MIGVNDLNAFNAFFLGYHASDRAANGSDANVIYWGFLNKAGDYYIMEQNNTNGTYRYYKGSGDYTTAWAARESVDYDYFDEIFKSN